MRALTHHSYGDVPRLTVGERDRPTFGANEALVRVRAASINAADGFMASGRPWPLRLMSGLFRPTRQILGLDVAGEVVSVGTKVTEIRVGDAVFGEARGTFAEYAAVPASQIVQKPAAISFEQAATLPVAGCTALQGLRDKARVKPGDQVLINGGSGSVGSFALQIARALGAEVTAVCSARNVERARELGATHVIDYGREDFSASDRRYDVIFDLVGRTPLRGCLRVLRPRGVYVSSAGRVAWVLKAALASLWPGSRVKVIAASPVRPDLETLASMMERGLISAPITERLELDQLPEALLAQMLGHAQGKSVVTL